MSNSLVSSVEDILDLEAQLMGPSLVYQKLSNNQRKEAK